MPSSLRYSSEEVLGEDIFKIIILNGRPAAGKSEIIDYLKKTRVNERIARFHIGEFDEIDDFPMIWAWFEEDDILTKMEKPRLHSNNDGLFLGNHLWGALIGRISLEYRKLVRDNPNYHDHSTAIIEFSRGKEHGGYIGAYPHLSDEILKNAAVLFIDVSFSESLRKNRKRFNPEKPDSILQHALDDNKLHLLYREIDWDEFTSGNRDYVEVRGIKIPYIVFPNEDDVTTERGDALGARLEDCLGRLWANYKKL